MSLDKELKELGIDVIAKVEDELVLEIAKNIATELKNTFQENNINYLEIYKTLIDTPMYYANITKEISEVNYYYKNSSMYFSSKMNLTNINEYILHECIHRIQERKDKKGYVVRRGICEINELTVKYVALNEAAIQYIASKILNKQKNLISVYGIILLASEKYYPIITNLIAQIVCLIGEKDLVDSTINANEEFKIEMIDSFGEAEFKIIEKNFDEILKIKNRILEMQESKETYYQNNNSIDEYAENIKNLYIETQNLIFNSYFERLLKMITTESEVLMLMDKLNSYKGIIGKVEGYQDFEEYFTHINQRAKIKLEKIKRNTAMVVLNDNIFLRIIRKIKKLFIDPQSEYNK